VSVLVLSRSPKHRSHDVVVVVVVLDEFHVSGRQPADQIDHDQEEMKWLSFVQTWSVK
jgi:hypothetical protein